MYVRSIEQIKIPLRAKGLTIEDIEPYLNVVFSMFYNNAKKIRKEYNVYCIDQKILKKERQHNDTDINNIVVIPNLFSAIEWKVGYICGNPIKYANTETNDVTQMTMFNKHCKSVNKSSVDEEVITWAEATGIGYYFIEPKSENYNINEVAPFRLMSVNADACCKVYSSYMGNEPLFDIIYTTHSKVENGFTKTVKIIDIYLPNYLYTYEQDELSSEWKRTRECKRGLYSYLPLVEKRRNKDGIGVVAIGEDLANTMDSLMSSSLDDIDEIINEFFVYYNVNVRKEEMADLHKQGKKAGAILLKDVSPEMKARLETITPKLSLEEVEKLFGIVNDVFHAVCGVPKETSDTNSGGTTKQGSEVANGYENAYNKAVKQTNYFKKADYELLERMLWIEKNSLNSIINFSTYEIDITYQINLTDNIYTKAQSFGVLIKCMPPSMALRFCRMSNEPEADGKKIEDSKIYQLFLKELQGNNTEPTKEENI